VRVSNLGWSKGDEAKDNPDAKLERSPQRCARDDDPLPGSALIT
jgi:hypothetical protein